MRLLYSPTSPYARKLRVLIREIDILDRIEEVAVLPMDDPAELAQVNPLGKVPVLVTGDTTGSIFDSPVIAAYLMHMPSKHSMPAEGDAHWLSLTIEALTDGIIDAAISLRIDEAQPAGSRNDSWAPRWRRQIYQALDALPGRLAQLDMHLNKEHSFSYPHICTAVALEYLDFRQSHLDWRKGREALADHHQRLWVERPSMVATRPG